jgi:hypothetical protein
MGLFSFSMPPDLRCKFIAALVLLGIALVALLGGVLGNIALDSVLKDQIKSFLVVDSESSSGYEDWQFDGAPDRTPQNMNYYLWNLTNPDEIINATRLNGTTPKPSYKLVGPFTYRRYAKKVNVSFVAGGNEVDFAHYIYYIFDSSLSTGDPSDASLRVTNLNSAYLGVLAQVGSEQNLVTALVGPSLLQLFEVISQPFGLVVAEVTTSQVLPLVRSVVLDGIQSVFNVSLADAQQIFATTWANETNPAPIAIWETLGTLAQGVPSNIPTSVVNELWDEQSILPNLVNSTESSALLWFAATYLQDPTAFQTLAQAFGLSQMQLQMVLSWRSQFLMTTGVPAAYQTFNVTSLGDLFYLQWGEGVVTQGVSVQQLLSGSSAFPPLAGIPEFAIWAQTFGSSDLMFNASFSRNLLNGTSGLFDPTNVATFLYLVTTQNTGALEQQFNLDLSQAATVAQYLNYIGQTFATSALETAFAAGGGLITTKTPQEWLWGSEDPLLKLLGLPATVALAYNMSDEGEALSGDQTCLFYTGKNDINQIATYIEYYGVRVYPAGSLWAEDEVVGGTEGYQFRPFLESSMAIFVWSYDLMRQIPLKFVKDVEIKGIDLLEYRIPVDFFSPDPKYYQTITGFANMTSSHRNVPVFISKPNMLDCEARWRNKIDGMEPSDADDTFLDVEPYIGYTMNVAKQLQPNIYIESANSPLNLFNQNFLKDVIYPIFYVNQQATISDEEANKFKNSVYLLLTVKKIVFWGGIVAGVLLAVGGAVMMIYVLLRKRSRGYEVIGEWSNTESDPDVFRST